MGKNRRRHKSGFNRVHGISGSRGSMAIPRTGSRKRVELSMDVPPPDLPGFWRPSGGDVKAVLWDLGQTLTPSSMAAILDRGVIMGLQESLCREGIRVGFHRLWVIVAWTFWWIHRKGKLEGRDFSDLEILDVVVRRLRGRRYLWGVPLLKIRERLYEDSYKVVKLTPEGIKAVEDLARMGIPQAVLTNGEYSSTFVWQVLKRSGVAQHIISVTVSSEEGMRKPNRELFLKACRDAGFKPSSTVYVGDTMEKDVKGALGVGMGAIHYGKKGIHDLGEVVTFVGSR